MKFCSFLILIYFSSCATIENSAQLYFKKAHNIKGVEPYESLMARMSKDQQLRELMYGKIKANHLLQCVILRNQLYTAAIKGASKEITDATRLMESGYQQDDKSFMRACDEIIATDLGKAFLQVQQEYMAHP
jgi:hypothetical protein